MDPVTTRLDLLSQALDEVAGRVAPETEARGRAVVAHATRRLAAGPQTVVALGGATGSGKSSLFNALSGTHLAEQGARRPTTSKALAASFSATNPELLDLLGVERRFEVEQPTAGMADLVLLDLPDHDSTASAHRDEVDRLVGLVDQFVWVLDPQKYADEAIHRRYLRPLARHREVITVVLNQADALTTEQLTQCLAHIRRLLDDDGLGGVPLLATSALTGLGIDDLRGRLIQLSQGKRAAAARLAADVNNVAAQLDAELGRAQAAPVTRRSVDALCSQLSAAAGVPLVVDAVRDSVRHRGQLATGWPLVKWLARLRPDPLRRLRLGGAQPQGELESSQPARSSLPARSAASAAHLSTGLRTLSNELGEGMPPLWREALGRVVSESERGLPEALDRAVVATDLRADRTPLWWQVIRAMQWVLIGAAVVGAAWLTLNAILGYLGLPPFAPYPVGAEGGLQVPLATVLLLGSIVAGIALSAISQLVINASARSAARRARKSLDAAVAEVAQARVLAPAEAEVGRYQAARKAIDQLL